MPTKGYEDSLAQALDSDSSRSRLLRTTLVAMLYALFAQQVVRELARWLKTQPSLRDVVQSLPSGGIPEPDPGSTAVFMHLSLAAIILVTSWVGWGRSHAPGNVEPLTRFVDWPLVVLAIDLSIVGVYFILVSQVDIRDVVVSTDGTTRTELHGVSATPEGLCVIAIFGLY
jgi:hypothetical protein